MLRSLTNQTTHLLKLPSSSPFPASTSRYSTSALDWLAAFNNYEQKGVPDAAGTDTADGFDLARVHKLMQALDSPHTAFPAVHIAGTKGKGSIVSMLSSILKHSGYTVGTYTSPHVVSFHERMAINGTSITPDALDALLSKYKSTIESSQQSEKGALSHFEIVTALAFRYFADSKVDIAVIETGLGGARDATNVLPAETVAAAVISAVGHDHAGALGGSIETIAAAKAGIMKQNRPVVLGRQPETAAGQVLVQHARKNDLIDLIHYAEKEVQILKEGKIFIDDGVAYQRCKFGLSQWATNALNKSSGDEDQEIGSGVGENLVELDVSLRLVGKHQLDNASTAITTSAILATSGQGQAFPKITKESIIQGLENAPILPGRFQICRLEANQGLAILDGAHTPESAAALVDTVRTLFPFSADKNEKNINSGDGADKAPPPLPVALVLAMASDKDLTGVCRELRQLQPNVAVFTEVPIAGGKTRSAAPGALVGAWQAAGMMVGSKTKGRPVRAREMIQASIKAAVARAAAELKALPNGDKGVIVVTGSMHAVGTALRDL
ncbi:hypothetical protein Ndes2526B_g00876 [Nannochloris sp. 'desiccata']|nr:putative Dihydrofolate synthetase [Chlorella desiccata (nom. nud.)]